MRFPSIFDEEKLARDERVLEIRAVKAQVAGVKAVASVANFAGFQDFVELLRSQRDTIVQGLKHVSTDREAAIQIGGLRAYDFILTTLSDSGRSVQVLEERAKQMEDQLRAADELVRRRTNTNGVQNDVSQPS